MTYGRKGYVLPNMESPLMEIRSPSWALLAEDDKLFTFLFRRFWESTFPDVELAVIESLGQTERLFAERQGEPDIAIVDLNLTDGSGVVLKETLSCPTILWSASPEGGCRVKPTGRDELIKTMNEIGKLLHLHPHNRGSDSF